MPSPSLALHAAALVALAVLVAPTATAAPAPTRAEVPATTFVGNLVGSPDTQAIEVDLGTITGVRYTYSSMNQSVLISATKNGKNNLCTIQFNSIVMGIGRPGWTRAEPLETYREIVAAARTPGGKILCVAPLNESGPGSINRVSFNGTHAWVTLGDKSWHEFQIILP